MNAEPFLHFAAWVTNIVLLILLYAVVKTMVSMLKRGRCVSDFAFDGVVLSGVDADQDKGPVKGWVSGNRTAVVCATPDLARGLRVQVYDGEGVRHLRTVVTVDRIRAYTGDAELAVIGVDWPWPAHVKRHELLFEDPPGGGVFVARLEREPVKGFIRHRKLGSHTVLASAGKLCSSDIGLPWMDVTGRVCGQTVSVGPSMSPDYTTLAPRIKKMIAYRE